MTLEEKIGQLFMVAGNGKNLETSYYQKIDSLIKKHGIGGVIFFQSGPDELKSLLESKNIKYRVFHETVAVRASKFSDSALQK